MSSNPTDGGPPRRPEALVDTLRASLEPASPAPQVLVVGERLPLKLRLRLALRRLRPLLVRSMIALLLLVLLGLFMLQQDFAARTSRSLPAAEVRIQLEGDFPPPLPTPSFPR